MQLLPPCRVSAIIETIFTSFPSTNQDLFSKKFQVRGGNDVNKILIRNFRIVRNFVRSLERIKTDLISIFVEFVDLVHLLVRIEIKMMVKRCDFSTGWKVDLVNGKLYKYVIKICFI